MKVFFTIIVVSLMLMSMYSWMAPTPEAVVQEHDVYEPPPELAPIVVEPELPELVLEEELTTPDILPELVHHSVPFTPQAPLAQWGDPRYQDACEEASIWMASLWAAGDEREVIDPVLATRELARLSDVSVDLFDTFVDTSAEDTLWLLRSDLPGVDAQVFESPSIEDLKIALAGGAIIVAPMDGQLLENPYFTVPGPERHMVVLIGYDDATREFITHDPGTRRGANFRYGYENFIISIRDYPTGDVLPITTLEKRVIVVQGNAVVLPPTEEVDDAVTEDALE